MKAWWFEPENGRLGYGDDRKPRKGVTHKVTGGPVLCERGLHASVRLIDALEYASSSVIWRVELGGIIVRGGDKCAATERTYIQRINIDDELRKFARLCAMDVIHLWDSPRVVLRYLKTGDESIRAAARDAAGDAARDAARAAARAAAWDAARAAARAAAWDAARDAAWAAAWAAARDAARAAAGAAARDAARAAAGAAAWDAARDAARAAAMEKQNRRLTRMVMEKMRAA